MESQYFYCKISGAPKEENSIDRLRTRVHQRMILVDPDIEVFERNFARLKFTLEWVGLPKNIDKIDFAYKAAVKVAEENLDGWEFSVSVMLLEKED